MTLVDVEPEVVTFDAVRTSDSGVTIRVTIEGPADVLLAAGQRTAADLHAATHSAAGEALRRRREEVERSTPAEPAAPPIKGEVLETKRLPDGSVFRKLKFVVRGREFLAMEGCSLVPLEDGSTMTQTRRHWLGDEPPRRAPEPPRPTDVFFMDASTFEAAKISWPKNPAPRPERGPAPDEVDDEMRAALAQRAQADPVERLRRERERKRRQAEDEDRRIEDAKKAEARRLAAEEANRRAVAAIAVCGFDRPGLARPPVKPYPPGPQDWVPPEPVVVVL